MDIVVEDGSGSNPDANSYSSLTDIRAYALARGVELSSDDGVLGAQVIQSMDFIEAYRARFKGMKTASTDPLQWPRRCVVIDGTAWPTDQIPKELKAALSQLCIEQFNGVVISPNKIGFAVQREKVDVLEVAYATGGTNQPGTQAPAPKLTTVQNLLDPLLKAGAGIVFPVRV